MLTECMQVLPSALWASRRSWKGVLLYNSSQPRSGQKSPLTVVVVVTKHSPSLYSRLRPIGCSWFTFPYRKSALLTANKLWGGRSPPTVVVVTKHISFFSLHRCMVFRKGEGIGVCFGLLPHSTLSLSLLSPTSYSLSFHTEGVHSFFIVSPSNSCTAAVVKHRTMNRTWARVERESAVW